MSIILEFIIESTLYSGTRTVRLGESSTAFLLLRPPNPARTITSIIDIALIDHEFPSRDPSRWLLHTPRLHRVWRLQEKVTESIQSIQRPQSISSTIGRAICFFTKCGAIVGKGTRFNAHKAHVDDYFTTKIYEFTTKCRSCANCEFKIRTNPKEQTFGESSVRLSCNFERSETDSNRIRKYFLVFLTPSFS